MHSTVSCACIQRRSCPRIDRHRTVGRLVDQGRGPLDQRRARGRAGLARIRLCHAARSVPAARSDARRPNAPSNAPGPPRPRRRDRPQPPRRHDRCGVPRSAAAPCARLQAYMYPPCAFPAPRAGGPGDRDRGLTHPNPSNTARTRPRLAHAVCSVSSRTRRQPGGDSQVQTRAVGRCPRPPSRARRVDTTCRGAPAGAQPNTRCRCARRTCRRPPARGVRGPQPSRTRRDHDAAQPTMRRTHQIPQLRADERRRRPRVLVRHQRARLGAARRTQPAPGSTPQPCRPCPARPPAGANSGAKHPPAGPPRREPPVLAERDVAAACASDNARRPLTQAAAGPARPRRTLHRRDRRPDEAGRHQRETASSSTIAQAGEVARPTPDSESRPATVAKSCC